MYGADGNFFGLSTDTKPVSPTNGWVFVEVDTGYAYVAVNNVWTLKTPSFGLKNQSVASVSGFATDTYLVGSGITLGSVSPLRIGSRYHCFFDVTKTAAGTAAPIITLRFGTLGTTGDAAVCTFTFNVQTAVVDSGVVEIFATFRTVGTGTSAVIQGQGLLRHNLAVTGLGSVNPTGWQRVAVTSGGFNSAVVNSQIGVSVNGGTSAAWTVTQVQAEITL